MTQAVSLPGDFIWLPEGSGESALSIIPVHWAAIILVFVEVLEQIWLSSITRSLNSSAHSKTPIIITNNGWMFDKQWLKSWSHPKTYTWRKPSETSIGNQRMSFKDPGQETSCAIFIIFPTQFHWKSWCRHSRRWWLWHRCHLIDNKAPFNYLT